MKAFTISGISFVPELWKPKKNLDRLLGYVDEAVQAGAQVIATPEGILDGYITKDLEKNKIREIDRDSKGYRQRVNRFKKRQTALAREIRETCIPPLLEKAKEHGVYLFANTLDIRKGQSVYNTTFVIDPDGRIMGKYDKIHAAFEVVNVLGKEHMVFETPYASLGVLICADRQFPETARTVALKGAQVLIINSYGMWGEGANERFIRQRAYENGLFVLFCHPNETVLVSPEGRIIGGTCGWEHILLRSIDPSQAVGKGLFGNKAMASTYEMNEESYGKRHKANQKRKKPEK